MKSYSTHQLRLMQKSPPEPRHFVHIYLPGETLYFSNANFKFDGHDYEAYLLNLPETALAIERFGGYLNITASLAFRDIRFRSYESLFGFFLDYPITKRDMDFFVLYLDGGIIPAGDEATLLRKVCIGEPKQIRPQKSFVYELFSVLYGLDSTPLYKQINRTTWPNAAAAEIGKDENRIIGSIRDVPCHCVDTGAASTLAQDVAAGAATIYLTEVDYPLPFATSGQVQIGYSIITYTGRNTASKSLTGCTWSAPARAMKRGDPVWQKRSSYKFRVSSKSVKLVSNVKVAGVKVADADRSISYADAGGTSIVITDRNLLKNQGAHSHSAAITEELHPTGGSFAYDSGMGASGTEILMRDLDESTACHVGVTGTTSGPKNATWVANFAAYTGYKPDAVYAVLVCDWQLGSVCGEYFRMTVPQTEPIGVAGLGITKYTRRIKLNSTTPPTSLSFAAHTNQGSPSLPCMLLVNVYEVWLELEFENLPVGGENAVWEKLAPLVTCDVDGEPDNGSGDYTGTPNALIENPADFLRYLIVGILGRSPSEIGTSFDAIRELLAGANYKIACLLNKVGKLPSQIAKSIQEQTALQMREDGGKFELAYLPAAPSGGGGGSYLPDFLPNDGTGITGSSEFSGLWDYYSCDDNESTCWYSFLNCPQWIGVDMGAGVTKSPRQIRIKPHYLGGGYGAGVKDFELYGSNVGGAWENWTLLVSGTHGDNDDWEEWTIPAGIGYRYFRLKVVNAYVTLNAIIDEWELREEESFSIDRKIYISPPVYEFTPISDIKNLIRATYDLDYGNDPDPRKKGDYFGEKEAQDSASIDKYRECLEEVAFPAIKDVAVVSDVIDWRLLQKKETVPMVSLVCNRMAGILEQNDYFALYDCGVAAWEGAFWRIIGVPKESRDKQRFEIKAIKYVAP